MAKSSKRTRSKGNSLPPAKQFGKTMADDGFEELQRGVSEENIIHSTFVSLGVKPRCHSLKSSSTMVKSNCLVGGRLLPLLRERLVKDLAILRRLTA